MAKILLMEGGKMTPIESKPFEQEAVLQTYLEQFPDLLPLDQVQDNPPRLLCIGREVPVPSGAIDLLLVDTAGRLTIVETKLAKNPEVRREVIGQIIEYASYVCQWDADQIERQGTQYFQAEGRSVSDLYEALSEKASDSDVQLEAETFRSKLEENLRKGDIRLVIAVDELAEPLRSTVTFLNSFTSFDLLILQLRDFELESAKHVFIASLFGYTKATKPPRAEWTWERYQRDLGWTEDVVNGVKSALDRLLAIPSGWQPEVRFNAGWINVFCFGRSAFGVQVRKKSIIEFWFPVIDDEADLLPTDITRRTEKTLYVRDDPRVTDDIVQQLCRASLIKMGLVTNT